MFCKPKFSMFDPPSTCETNTRVENYSNLMLMPSSLKSTVKKRREKILYFFGEVERRPCKDLIDEPKLLCIKQLVCMELMDNIAIVNRVS